MGNHLRSTEVALSDHEWSLRFIIADTPPIGAAFVIKSHEFILPVGKRPGQILNSR